MNSIDLRTNIHRVLVCWFWGHKRGKRVGQGTGTKGGTVNDYACPRCGARWSRKVRKAKA